MLSIKRHVLKDWPQIRARGKTRFILTYGVLLWGGGTTALSTVLFYLFAGNIDTLRFFIIVFSVFPVFGVLLGADLWRCAERDAQKPARRD